MANLDDTLRDKTITNGNFGDMSGLAQGLKFALRRGKNWDPLSPACKEALELIQTRVAMILSGDPNYPEHWNDIASLARLVGKDLETTQKPIDRLAEIQRARQAAGIKLMNPAVDDTSDLEGQE